jgi:hypothetical protein
MNNEVEVDVQAALSGAPHVVAVMRAEVIKICEPLDDAELFEAVLTHLDAVPYRDDEAYIAEALAAVRRALEAQIDIWKARAVLAKQQADEIEARNARKERAWREFFEMRTPPTVQ